ncbi:4-hydroxy-tetrahydrodipicolinate synthase [Seminavis robusta]|uniref:4-hydroxy-tetrahydrodipicolinate synthase n=1 Tax=Seminavis robusta TaxID=568900 RepID=A0A9N8GZN2_9STRA|nr:4-hydroxy-tetrahydrodipicolinate synthase [Seminavis robusta]|eukprot:Sro6_g005090.1 4-hydroxy-tetrahydrodipicolinate synthase (340) ;mRNA; f:96312-97331
MPAHGWNEPLQGIITPLATPLLDHDVLDEPSTRKLLDHVIEGGVAGIFLLGSTGEGPSLSYQTRRNLIQLCCQHTQQQQQQQQQQHHGNIPVLVGISDTAWAETVAMAHCAETCGATAVVLAPPYYFTMGQAELIHYTEMVLQATCLPILLYNIPFLTKTQWNVETVLMLAQTYPDRIVGIKDSSGNLDYFQQLCRIKQKLPQFTVLMGPEHLLPQAIQAGADGGVNGGSNVLPKLFVDLYQALSNNHNNHHDNNNDANTTAPTNTQQQLVQQVNDFQAIYNTVDEPIEHPFGRLIRGTKCALVAMGIIEHLHVNPPFHKPTEMELEKTREILQRLDIR